MVNDEVRTALHERRGVVALESTIVVQGLPAPINLEVAVDCEAVIREGGAVPATIGLLDGRIVVGLTMEQVARLAAPSHGTAKLSTRDLGPALATRQDGATTVAATIACAARVGIKVMATGGLGGVHRDAITSFDESADLTALSRTSVLVVASGVKSILDIGATLERLDSLGVPVIGYQTKSFPGFYRSDSGFVVDWSVQNAREVAAAFLAHQLFSSSGLLLANPVDQERQLDEALHDQALASGLAQVAALSITGKEVTPVLLGEFARFTSGLSVQVNRDLVVGNARLAGRVATELATLSA